MEDKKQILLVDDDEFLLDMYAVKFRELGFDVHTSAQGEEALEKLRSGLQPDAIVFDMVMPGMDGEKLLTALHEEKSVRGAKLVALSNQADPEIMEKAKEIGVDAYILKANTVPSQVVSDVAKILEKGR